MSNLTQKLASLGRQRLIAIGAASTAIIALAAFGLSIATAPDYRPLSTGLDATSASEIVRSLEQSGYAPKISDDGSVISLPGEDLARARMTLAEVGLPASGSAGWELFDDASGIGMNSFTQRVNRLRALEGELARSIQTITSVDSARVHLVLPERETFSQDRPQPTASVIVRMKRNQPMTQKQAQSVRALVSAAVPELAAEKVTVLSASGETILSDDNSLETGFATKRAAIEDRLARNIESILTARVGAGNVRVRVAADLEETRQVFVEQTFDPEQQVARKESALKEQSSDRQASDQGVDAANNMPGLELGGQGGQGRQSQKSKVLDETSYEIGSTRSEKITEAGGIKRLTVAVLVNGTMQDGVYTDRTENEIQRLTALAQSAAGINPDRGDVVTVESLRFVDDMGLLDDEESASAFEELIATHFGTILRGTAAIVIVALILFLGVRPIVRAARPTTEPADAGMPGDTDNAADQDDAASDTNKDVATKTERDGDHSDYISLDSVSGGVIKRYVEELTDLVNDDPEKAARALKTWINQRS